MVSSCEPQISLSPVHVASDGNKRKGDIAQYATSARGNGTSQPITGVVAVKRREVTFMKQKGEQLGISIARIRSQVSATTGL